MYRDFFTNRWVLGGVAFLIVFSVACFLWYHYDTAPDKRDTAEVERIVQQWQDAKKTNTGNLTEDETNIAAEFTMQSAEKPKAEVINNVIMENDKDVRVSPYGFGPYPEIPPDFPTERNPPWTWSDEKRQKLIGFSKVSDILRDGELIYRVYIKKWNEGMRILPAAKVDPNTDRVYLMYPNTVYVTYDYVEKPDGTLERFISDTEAYGVQVGVDITKDDILKGNVPNHITIKSWDENEGIDPYSYLGLKQ